MPSRTRVAASSKRPFYNRLFPDSPAEPARYQAFLVLVIVPSLIFFMSRKAVDRVHHTPLVADHPSAFGTAGPARERAARPAFARIAPRDPDSRFSNLIYSRAMILARAHDSRPYWKHSKLEVGASTDRATADLVIEHLIPCESMGRTVNRVDTNGKMSYGILQFQDWQEWEAISGISGDPDNRDDAIRMAEWAIQNGMINHWTCASVLKMI